MALCVCVCVCVCMYAIACIRGLILNATKFVANLVHFHLPRNLLVPCFPLLFRATFGVDMMHPCA